MQSFVTLTTKGSGGRQVNAGSSFILLTAEDGSLWAYGDNFFGQLGLGDNCPRDHLTKVQISERVIGVSTGVGYSAVITEHGDLYTCGLAEGTVVVNTLTKVELPERVKQVSCGGLVTAISTAVVTEDGSLLMCGRNDKGQLGLGDKENRKQFTRVEVPEPVQQVSVGMLHTALITESGQLWVCGYNRKGQLGLTDNVDRDRFTRVELTERVKKVSAAVNHTAIVSESGRLWLSDRVGNGFIQATLPEPVSQVSVGGHHTAVITETGRLWLCGLGYSWLLGFNDDGSAQRFTELELNEPVMRVSITARHIALITAKGRAWATTDTHYDQPGLCDDRHRRRFVPLV